MHFIAKFKRKSVCQQGEHSQTCFQFRVITNIDVKELIVSWHFGFDKPAQMHPGFKIQETFPKKFPYSINKQVD